MKRALPLSLIALVLVLTLSLALSLSIAPTLAQDSATPTATAEPGTGGTGAGETGAQVTPVFLGGDESTPAVQVVLSFFETFDAALLAPEVQYRDYTQPQGLTTSQDVLGPANYLNTAFSEQEYTIRRVLTVENTVVIEFDFTGVNTGSFMGAQPTQQTVTIPMVAIIELGTPEGGEQGSLVITRFDLYYDASVLAQQLGFTLQAPGMGAEPGAGETGGEGTGGEGVEGEDTSALAPSITVNTQQVAEDSTLTVARVVSPVNGWVDIHADSSGAPGAIIGYAQIAAGETLNVPVPVDSNAVTATLYAMLHVDEGQIGVHEFPGPDAPMTDAQGNVVVVPFTIGEPEAESGEAAGEAQTVDVSLIDGQINMPTTLAPGRIVFNVTNDGTMEHNFEIEGQGIEQALNANLQPGESGQLEVELQAGTYTVYCPVADHADQGMRLELTVQ
ncbi:MAG TPA: hypothetical protein PKD46_10325 [Aggregatilineaceae bacterium]|nr:hypothetical protein [Aggregatilineaceae bacterium]